MSAATKLVGLLGYPVAHSLSPAMHEAAFAALGLDLRYLAFAVEPARLAEAVAGAAALGVVGLNVTVPHKVAALALCDPDGLSRRVGAVNTLVFGGGDGGSDGARAPGPPRGLNTDVHGFARLLDEAGVTARGARAVLLGAGGAARAVAVALCDAGAASITLLARRPAPFSLDGEALEVAAWEEGQARLSRCDLLVDCTPRGLDPGAAPLALDALPDHAAVLDLVVRPTTALVEAARARGLRAAPGTAMLLHQGAAAFEACTGRAAPLAVMRAALLAALGAS